MCHLYEVDQAIKSFKHSSQVIFRYRQWESSPELLPGKSHGRRSLVGYSPWGRKESDTTERLHFHFRYRQVEKHSLDMSWE